MSRARFFGDEVGCVRQNGGRGRALRRGFATILGAVLGLGFAASPAWASVPGTPAQPSVSPGNAQITVTFTAPASNGGKPITKYTASCTPVDPDTGIFEQVSNSGAVAPIVVTGVTNGAAYNCSIHATNADGSSNESPDSATVVVGAPAAPAQPSATAGHAQITVAFSAPANNGSPITSYSATCSSGTGVPGTNTGASSPIVITDLTNGASYTCTVTAMSAVGPSPASPPSAAVTPFVSAPAAPPPPTAARGDTKIGVIFTPPTDNGGSPITSYTASCTSFSGNPGTATGPTSPLTVTGLTNGASYTCTVTATNALGTSPPSLPSASVVPAPVPDVPPQPTVSPHDSSIVVTFTAPPDNGTPIAGYTATCVSSDGGVPVARTGTTSPITVTGLSNSHAYTCTVTATSATGTGPPSPPSLPVVPTTVPAPPILRAAGPGDGAAVVSFTPSNSGGVNANFKVACTSSNSGAPGLASGPKSPITVPGLSNGKIYTCAVRAHERAGHQRPVGHLACVHRRHTRHARHHARRVGTRDRVARPLNVTFNPGNVNGSPISEYRATCRQDATGTATAGTGLSSPILVTNLLTGHGYSCSVVATNARGTSAASNSVHATVGTPSVPPVTRVLKIRNGVVMSFVAPAGNGAEIDYYQAHCASSNGGAPSSTLQLVSPIVADNLTTGRTYTCTLAAVNSRVERALPRPRDRS